MNDDIKSICSKNKKKGSWLRIGVDVRFDEQVRMGVVVQEEVSGGEGMGEEKVRCQLLRLNYMWENDVKLLLEMGDGVLWTLLSAG